MARLLQILFFLFIIKPLTLIVLGLNIINRENLPLNGPAILAANHNSHLDTMVLMSLFGLSQLSAVKPVAAADYFLKNRFLSWFSTSIIGIIPIQRKNRDKNVDPLQGCSNALQKGEIILLFPEGSRGEPEILSEFKKGISILAERHPDVPIYPIYMHGLGKCLPRGNFLLVPFFCDIFVGSAMFFKTSRDNFMLHYERNMKKMCSALKIPKWM